MKKLIKLLLIASLFIPLTVLGAPLYSFTSTLQPSNSLTDVGSTTLSAYRNIVAQWFTATSSTASLFPYASTTALSATTICFIGDNCRTTWPTGNSTWSTTTSQVSGQLINYPNNNTDIVSIGSNSTTTSKFFFDPNAQIGFASGRLGIGTTSSYSVLGVINSRNTSLNVPLFTVASTTNGLSTTTLMTILANGNTGIRNTNPRGYLDVGSVNVNGFGESIPAYRLAVNDQSSGGGAGLLVSNSGTVSGTSSIIFKSPTTGDIRPFSSGQIISGFTTTGYTGAYLGLGSASGANRYNNEVFLTKGRVGIGTTSPESLLDVEGLATFGTESAATAQVKVKGGASGQPMITLSRTSGGTVQYSWALAAGGLSFTDDVSGAGTANLFGDSSSNDLYLGLRGKVVSDAARPSLLSGTTYNASAGSDTSAGNMVIQGGLGVGAGTPGDIQFKTGTTLSSGTTLQTGTVRATIKNSTGNMGIGTTSPYKKLSVAGDIVMDSFNATSTTATSTIAGALKYGRAGTVTLGTSGTPGTETVNVPIDNNSVIFLTQQNCVSCGTVWVESTTTSSFTIISSGGADLSTIGWMVIQK